LPDNQFDTVPLLAIARLIENLIEKTKPSLILTHSSADCNVDHRRVHEAVLAATRPVNDCPVKEVLAFEVLSSTEWGVRQFAPTLFVDISSTIEKKIQAFNCYQTEKREFPHPRSEKAIRAAAARWGSVAGCEAAEAFEVVRQRR
jgi:LmbE family N-acetylglucosaminyl deacetylase